MHYTRYMSLAFTLCTILLLCGCSGSNTQETNDLPDQNNNSDEQSTSEVYAMPRFNVTVQSDVKYAEALRHATWNSNKTESIDLLLDIYSPDNDDSKRPLVIFIHGGGFKSGNKSVNAAHDQLMFYAERGFVGISINYRLKNDYGTLPPVLLEAIDNSSLIPPIQRDLFKAMYPAIRDAKAAVRWAYSQQASLGIDTDKITVIGASAGAVISVALGVVNETDFTNEISLSEDPSLSTTHLSSASKVHTVIDYWGSGVAVYLLDLFNEGSRWDINDAPLSIVHGTTDQVVLFSQAEALRDEYMNSGAKHVFYPLEGEGHSAWDALIDGKTLEQVALRFIVDAQGLELVE